MNEGFSTMTCDVFMEPRRITGVPGVAVRLGRALEDWGRKASQPVDREAQRREYERQVGNEARMLHVERLVRHLG